MPSIVFDRFDLGIDLRKDAAVSDANRLRQMKNAYVTTGLTTAKRPGFTKVCTLEPGTKGLYAALGKLHTFYGSGTVTHANPLFEAHKVAPNAGEKEVKDVWYSEVFANYLYVSVEYADGTTLHHYLDGNESGTQITDENCPHSKVCFKAQSKIFAVGVDGDVVRFCAAGRPRDWSSEQDAGFLPTGMNARGDRIATALGIQRSRLAVLTRDSCQLWTIDPDPASMGLYDMCNVGSSFPKTVCNVSNDLYFLSDYGVRSITTQAYTENLVDQDVGSPIDKLVIPEIENAEVAGIVPRSFYFYGTGQYVLCFGNHLFVYSISKTSKIAAWSEYFLNFEVEAVAELGKKLYIRSGDDVYLLDENVSTDGGMQYEVLVELPWMDMKKPGELKMIQGIDAVLEGSAWISLAYDSRDPDARTPEVLIKGNTRPLGMIPIPCCGTEISIRLRNYDDKGFKLNALSMYYEILGVR